jgi:hypothetical protein
VHKLSVGYLFGLASNLSATGLAVALRMQAHFHCVEDVIRNAYPKVPQGSCDPSVNLLPNKFNIALSPVAGSFVCYHFTEFPDFAVVPSHSAQSTKYSSVGLKQEDGRCLERRVLGSNCQGRLKIAEKQVTIEKDYPNQACPMPDLMGSCVHLSLVLMAQPWVMHRSMMIMAR